MALIKCPECGKEISDKAASCPYCGCPMAETVEMQQPIEYYHGSERKANNSSAGGCGKVLLIILAVIGCIILIGAFSGLSSGPDNWNNETHAKSYAQLMVKDNLKAPSTAKFCNSAREMTAKNLGGAKWKVTGWVDAENSFGAMIRSDFEVVLELNKNGATRISCTIKKR